MIFIYFLVISISYGGPGGAAAAAWLPVFSALALRLPLAATGTAAAAHRGFQDAHSQAIYTYRIILIGGALW